MTTSKSTNNVLLASDIFGLTSNFKALISDLQIDGRACVVSPYDRLDSTFLSESEAYQCFQSIGGMDAYIGKLTNVMNASPGIKYLIGFSAGAAALYRVMSQSKNLDVQLILFYPGQIRFYLDQAPSAPCSIIFAQNEPHFSVTEVINKLQAYKQIDIQRTAYRHGFMNPASDGFDIQGYREYCDFLKAVLAPKEQAD